MKRPLDKVLQDHLNSKQLDALRSMQRAHDEAPPAPKPRRNARIAVTALLVRVAGLTVPWASRFGKPENLIDEISAEVVQNHLHRKPLEVDTTRIAGIQEYFCAARLHAGGESVPRRPGTDPARRALRFAAGRHRGAVALCSRGGRTTCTCSTRSAMTGKSSTG